MSEKEMPVAEANEVEVAEANHYEFAFHVLPTVAEGEVPAVYEAIKTEITKAGAEITTEEAPKRVELAYEIVKPIEGKNRKFGSAYFGWVRFAVTADALAALTEELESKTEILRSLTIKLTRVEEENPFYYHEAMESVAQVTTIEEKEVTAAKDTKESEVKKEDDSEEKTEENDTVEVSESESKDSEEEITK